jgi:tRNA (guanine37-N1)-methyltransferase
MAMRIDVVTIFPEYLAPLDVSLLGKARARGLIDLRVHDLRSWALDRHRTVDDTPYGGGPGMVMKPEPWGAALDEIVPEDEDTPRMIVPTPSGRPFTQELAVALAAEPWLLFACGRYEGIDRRAIEEGSSRMRVEEISIGDYVLAGGEVAVLVIVEAVARLLPGVLGNEESVHDDSFALGAMTGLLEGPVYTKPACWRSREVPSVLLSGNHAAIARWRREEALRRTATNRPDLIRCLDPAALDRRDREVLAELGWVDHNGTFSRISQSVAD